MAGLTRGHLRKLLKAYDQVLEVEPGNTGARLKAARALRLLGRNGDAIVQYRILAQTLAAKGDPMGAILACKSILELDPRHHETQSALAMLYTRLPERAARVAVPVVAGERPEEPVLLSPGAALPGQEPRAVVEHLLDEADLVPLEAPEPGPGDSGEFIDPGDLDGRWQNILEDFRQGMEDSWGGGVQARPSRYSLPEVPLFSSLGREVFVKILGRLERRQVPRGEVLVREGQETHSFFIVASGLLRITKKMAAGREVGLSLLRESSFFGEFHFLTGARSRVNVVAVEDSELLIISRDTLEEVITEHPEVERTLWKFMESRLVESFLASSPIFRSLGRDRRFEVAEFFTSRWVPAGTAILKPGQQPEGLYLVMMGVVEVSLEKDGRRMEIERLREGEFLGVTSMSTDEPETCELTASRDCQLLVLPREKLAEIMAEEPMVATAISTISGMRKLHTQAMFSGSTEYGEMVDD